VKTYKLRLEEKMSSAKFEETGSYIMLLSMVISLILDCYSISFLIFRSPCLIASSFFYTVSPSHLRFPHACPMVGVDTCSISPSQKSSCSSCKTNNHCSDITSTLMWLES